MVTRTATASVLLVVEVGLAVLGVLVHYGFTTEYANVTDSTWEGFVWGFSAGLAGLALAVVLVAAGVAAWAAPRRSMRWTALAVPVVMLLGMFAVTPLALAAKRATQYAASPQCLVQEDGEDGEGSSGPGVRAARQSQAAFDSIELVGLFGGGGGSGVGGCDRTFVLTDQVDVLQHYRSALPAAGWSVVDEAPHRIRGERGDLAFEVVTCGQGGVVWAGPKELTGRARCDGAEIVGVP